MNSSTPSRASSGKNSTIGSATSTSSATSKKTRHARPSSGSAGWQSTTAAAQHLDRLKQMQSQIYRILAERSGKPLRQIIRDTKRTDFYLDAFKAREYGLIDNVLGPAEAVLPEQLEPLNATAG